MKKIKIGLTAVAIIIALAMMIAVPRHIKNSRNEAAISLVQRIALVEVSTYTEDCRLGCSDRICEAKCYDYAYTDGVNETAEEAVKKLIEYAHYREPSGEMRYYFLPDPSVAFHIMPSDTIDGLIPEGFIIFATHNSVGSPVYVYDKITGGGVKEARENEVYGGVTVTSSVADLYCYQYDPSEPDAAAVKTAGSIKFAPDQKDKAPARRMVVTAVAE